MRDGRSILGTDAGQTLLSCRVSDRTLRRGLIGGDECVAASREGNAFCHQLKAQTLVRSIGTHCLRLLEIAAKRVHRGLMYNII